VTPSPAARSGPRCSARWRSSPHWPAW
jgi:hypothetical protein